MKNYEMRGPEQTDETLQKQLGLQALRQIIANGPYPGYPEQRLFSRNQVIDSQNLPRGPWDTHDRDQVTVAHKVHPWLPEMLQDASIGVVTGKGVYWHFGPNYTVDPIIMRYQQSIPEVVLIQRKDTGHWALPGGFIDDKETPVEAAVREAQEETSINLGRLAAHAVKIYQGPVADARITAHAWAETTALRFDIFNQTYLPSLELVAGDDAADARWVAVNKIETLLFGSHKQLIDLALNGEV